MKVSAMEAGVDGWQLTFDASFILYSRDRRVLTQWLAENCQSGWRIIRTQDMIVFQDRIDADLCYMAHR
jgi:hypothetical protein